MMILNLLIAFLSLLLRVEPGAGDAGGAASGEPPTPKPPTPKPPAPPAPPTGGGESGDGAPAAEGGEGSGEPSDDSAAQKASREAAKSRIKAKEAEESKAKLLTAMRPLLDQLGIKVEGLDPDPTELTKSINEWKGKYLKERVSNAIQRQAVALGARPEALTRYLRGGDELGELDPEGDQFEQELKAVVQRALSEEPGLKVAAAPPPKSGAEFNGSTGKTIDEQIADAEKSGDYKTSLRLKMAKQEADRQAAGSAST